MGHSDANAAVTDTERTAQEPPSGTLRRTARMLAGLGFVEVRPGSWRKTTFIPRESSEHE